MNTQAKMNNTKRKGYSHIIHQPSVHFYSKRPLLLRQHKEYISSKKPDIARVIPKGRKYVLWFRNNNGGRFKNQVLLIDLKNNKQTTIQLSYDETLCSGDNGTMIYGTIIHCNERINFMCEDVLYFNGMSCGQSESGLRMYFMNNIVERIKNVYFHDKSITVSLCPHFFISVDKEYNDFITYIESHQIYDIYSIHYIRHNDTKWTSLQLLKPATSYVTTFDIKASKQQDIYELYKAGIYFGIALIPDYNTSVMMNSYFRNIRENENLDLLEESDDEEDFENPDEYKFVDVDKILSFTCEYSKQFQQWIPISHIPE